MESKKILFVIGAANLVLVGVVALLLFAEAPGTQSAPPKQSVNIKHSESPLPTAPQSVSTEIGALEPDYSSARMPAALAEMDPGIFMATDLQVAEWEALQEEFINEVGNKLPSNAAEWQRWESARKANDEMFRIKFGEEIYRQQAQAAGREGAGHFP